MSYKEKVSNLIRSKRKSKKGFTLIELLIVIAIIGILVLLAVPSLLGQTEKAKEARIKNDIKATENTLAYKLVETGKGDVYELFLETDFEELESHGIDAIEHNVVDGFGSLDYVTINIDEDSLIYSKQGLLPDALVDLVDNNIKVSEGMLSYKYGVAITDYREYVLVDVTAFSNSTLEGYFYATNDGSVFFSEIELIELKSFS